MKNICPSIFCSGKTETALEASFDGAEIFLSAAAGAIDAGCTGSGFETGLPGTFCCTGTDFAGGASGIQPIYLQIGSQAKIRTAQIPKTIIVSLSKFHLFYTFKCYAIEKPSTLFRMEPDRIPLYKRGDNALSAKS